MLIRVYLLLNLKQMRIQNFYRFPYEYFFIDLSRLLRSRHVLLDELPGHDLVEGPDLLGVGQDELRGQDEAVLWVPQLGGDRVLDAGLAEGPVDGAPGGDAHGVGHAVAGVDTAVDGEQGLVALRDGEFILILFSKERVCQNASK